MEQKPYSKYCHTIDFYNVIAILNLLFSMLHVLIPSMEFSIFRTATTYVDVFVLKYIHCHSKILFLINHSHTDPINEWEGWIFCIKMYQSYLSFREILLKFFGISDWINFTSSQIFIKKPIYYFLKCLYSIKKSCSTYHTFNTLLNFTKIVIHTLTYESLFLF